MSLLGREVILGVGGGIAAYKSCDLVRRLQDAGYSVTVVPTPASLHFVGAATWEALSGRPVHTQVWESVHTVPHIALADRADYFLIAPATADLIARIAHGRADDLLTNLVLASDVPKMIVPAMHPSMWLDPATVSNVQTLRDRGFMVMDPAVGRLTGKDIGPGRFPEIVEIIEKLPCRPCGLHGKKTCHSFHIVLQSGSNVILKRMNRRQITGFYPYRTLQFYCHNVDLCITVDELIPFLKEIGFSLITPILINSSL